MATYRKYSSDADKVKVYNHHVRQGEEALGKWEPSGNKAWERYEAKSRPEARTANGHNISGSTPMYIGNIDSQYSAMTAADIEFVVRPRGKGTEDQAYVATAALNQEFDETKANERGNDGIKDGLIVGLGWAKVGYEYYDEKKTVPRPEEDVLEEVNRLIEEAEGVDGAPDALTIMGQVPLEEEVTIVLADRIVVDYAPWNSVILDPTAKRFSDLHWLAQKQMMTADELKNNPLFREYCASRRQLKKLDQYKADATIDKSVIGTGGTPTSEDERFSVYTIWDFDTGTICVFLKDADFLLYETVNPFSIFPDVEDKSPFVPVILRRTTNRIRGVSETDVLSPICEEKDLYHSRLATFLERSLPRVMAEEGTFTLAGKEALRSQEIGAVVELERGHSPQDVGKVEVPQLMSEMYQMPEKLEKAAENATGLSEVQRGLFPDRKRTATETTSVVAAAATRAAEKRIALERFWRGIAKRILVLMQMYYEEERVVRMVDEAGEFAWGWNAEDIAGQFDLEVFITPKETRSWQERRDDALAVLNVIGPMAQPGPDGSSPVDVSELLKYVLEEFGLPRRTLFRLLNLPEEQQKQVLANMQSQAAMMQAQGGMVRPDMVPGPMDAGALAAATNQGTIPPEMIAAATGILPNTPQAAEAVSESRGVVLP